MADTAALVVALSAQLTQFEKDMVKANKIASDGVQKIESTFSKANIHIGGLEELGNKLTKLLTVGGIIEIINLLGELNEKVARIGDSSERLGITTDKLQALHFAAVETGSSVEKMDAFLDRFARTVAEAGQGSGKLYEFLKVNNIEAAKFAKLGLVEQLEQYSKLVANAKTPQAALNDVFLVGGRNAADLANAIKLIGTEGLDPLEEKARAAGVVIDETLIAQAKKAAAEWNILKLQIQVFFETMALSANQARKDLSNNMESDARSTTDTLKKYWKQFIDYMRDTNPEALRNAKELWDGLTEIAKTAQRDIEFAAAQKRTTRQGSEILSPGLPASFDERFKAATPSAPGKPTEDFSKQADDLNKLLLAEQKRTEVLQAEALMVGQTAGATAELKTQVRLENEALEKNIPLTDQAQEKIYQAAVAAGKAADAVYKAQQAWQGMNAAVQFAGNQMIDIMVGLTQKTLTAQQAMSQLTNALVKAILQASLLGQGPLASIMGLAPSAAGGTGGLLGQLFKGLSVPGKQGGGSVSAGHPYIVGEHGMELFVPSHSGQIVPGQLTGAKGGGSTSVEINNYMAAESETRQTQQSDPGGGERIIIDIVKKAQARGAFDDSNRGRFALRPQKVR